VSTHSPFAEIQTEAGARFTERFGVSLPEHFGDPEGEYRAARRRVGLLDLSFRGTLCLEGRERLRWLNGQVTADVASLQAGQGVLAAALNAKGRILADLVVYGRADSVWIDLPRHRAELVRDSFTRHIIADDVTVTDASERLAHLLLAGPEAPPCAASVLGEAATALHPWRHAEVEVAGVPVVAAANRWLGVPGFDLRVPAEAAGTIWRLAAERGASPVGMAALDILRIEAGWPWCGPDFGEEHLLLEALSDSHVSFHKGCYLGQEVVTRIQHRGHLNKKLCGLTVAGESLPARGAAIYSGGRAVGRVASATFSPALGSILALGYLWRECWDPGTRLQVDIAGRRVEAAAAALPFVET
jgi:folate-binding protein YgfZ